MLLLVMVRPVVVMVVMVVLLLDLVVVVMVLLLVVMVVVLRVGDRRLHRPATAVLRVLAPGRIALMGPRRRGTHTTVVAAAGARQGGRTVTSGGTGRLSCLYRPTLTDVSP